MTTHYDSTYLSMVTFRREAVEAMQSECWRQAEAACREMPGNAEVFAAWNLAVCMSDDLAAAMCDHEAEVAAALGVRL
jgi:hypothetical protein